MAPPQSLSGTRVQVQLKDGSWKPVTFEKPPSDDDIDEAVAGLNAGLKPPSVSPTQDYGGAQGFQPFTPPAGSLSWDKSAPPVPGLPGGGPAKPRPAPTTVDLHAQIARLQQAISLRNLHGDPLGDLPGKLKALQAKVPAITTQDYGGGGHGRGNPSMASLAQGIQEQQRVQSLGGAWQDYNEGKPTIPGPNVPVTPKAMLKYLDANYGKAANYQKERASIAKDIAKEGAGNWQSILRAHSIGGAPQIDRDQLALEADIASNQRNAPGFDQKKIQAVHDVGEAINKFGGKIVAGALPLSQFAPPQVQEGAQALGESVTGLVNPISISEFAHGVITDPVGTVGGAVESINDIWRTTKADGSPVSIGDRVRGAVTLGTIALGAAGHVGGLTKSVKALVPDALKVLRDAPKTPENLEAIKNLEAAAKAEDVGVEFRPKQISAPPSDIGGPLAGTGQPLPSEKPPLIEGKAGTSEPGPVEPVVEVPKATQSQKPPKVDNAAPPMSPGAEPTTVTVPTIARAQDILDSPPASMKPGDVLTTDSGARWVLGKDRVFEQTHGYGGEAVKETAPNAQKAAPLVEEKPNLVESPVLYHGTTKPGFETFNTDAAPKLGKEQLMLGAHFSEDPALAEEYAKETPGNAGKPVEGGAVIQAKVNLKNPLDIWDPALIYEGDPRWALYQEGKAKLTPKQIKDARLQQYEGTGTTKDGYPQDGAFVSPSAIERVLDSMHPKDARALVEKHGYDGVVYDAIYGGSELAKRKRYKSYIAFSPEQIERVTAPESLSPAQLRKQAILDRVKSRQTPTPEGTEFLGSGQLIPQEVLDKLGGWTLPDILEYGKAHLEEVGDNFKAWSQEMASTIGEAVRPHLEAVWNQLKGEEDATQEIKQQKSGVREHPNRDVGGQAAEAGGGNRTERPAPSEGPKAKEEVAPKKPATAGVAQKVLEERGLSAKPGQGTTPEQMVKLGRAHEHEAEGRIKTFEDDPEHRVNETDIAAYRAKAETLAKAANKAIEVHDANPSKATWDAMGAAVRAEDAWANRIKPALSKFHPIGEAMQGRTELDTGSWSAMSKAAAEKARGPGSTPTPAEIAEAKNHARVVGEYNNRIDALNQRIQKILEGRRAERNAPGLPKTNTDRVAWIAERKKNGTLYSQPKRPAGKQSGAVSVGKAPLDPDVIRVIWDHAKENYIDPRTEAGMSQGPLDIGDVIDRTANDLRLDPLEVREAIVGKKTQISRDLDAMYRLAHERRKAVAAAKNFVEFAKIPKAAKVLKNIGGWIDPRGIAVFGHGTVGLITHAGTAMFSPADMAAWGRNFRRQFQMVGSPGVHEALMNHLESLPEYGEMLRNGLKVDRGFNEDYQTYAFSRERALGRAADRLRTLSEHGGAKKALSVPSKALDILGGGNRGFDALKLLRAEMYSRYMAKVPAELRADVGPLMADMVNHATGVGKSFPGASKVMFAPALEASRWARIIGDPVKVMRTFGKAAGSKFGLSEVPTPAEMYVAKLRAKRAAYLVGTYMSALGVNYGLQAATGQGDKVNFLDPTHADWLRFKWNGNTFDPIGGTLAPLRLIAGILAIGTRDPAKFYVQTGQDRKSRITEDLGQYAVSKLTPTLGVPAEVAFFKHDFSGRPLPNASDLEKVKAAKQGKLPMGWGEYALTKGPIPIADVGESLLEGFREAGVPESRAKQFMNLMGHSAAALSGVRIGTTSTRPPKNSRAADRGGSRASGDRAASR